MEEDNWLCLWGLSVAYSKQEEWHLAIQTLEETVESIKSRSFLVDLTCVTGSIVPLNLFGLSWLDLLTLA